MVAAQVVKDRLERITTLNFAPPPTGTRLGLPRTSTLSSTLADGGKMFDWGDMVKVGRNSIFYDLTQEQEDELGGVEYRVSRNDFS
jgi:hypothetical protein